MITDEERVIRQSQGYDIGFEYSGKKYWINSSTWNEEKEGKLFQETGLKSYREGRGNRNLVIYNPEYFANLGLVIGDDILSYIKGGSNIKNVPQPINMSSCYKMFSCSYNVKTIDLTNWDMSSIISCNFMFDDCKDLENLITGEWDLRKVRDMGSMFKECKNLKYLDLHNWKLRDVQSMFQMFSECSSLEFLDLSNWELLDMQAVDYMFEYCTQLSGMKLTYDFFPSCVFPESLFQGCDRLRARYNGLTCRQMIEAIINETQDSLKTLDIF